MSMLEIKKIRIVYPNGYEALKSVSMTAEAGEIVAVVGSSGAGKSTLLRAINGLLSPSAGSIMLDGEEITALDEAALQRARRKIGFIWQEYNLVERLSVLTNVLTGRLGYLNDLPTMLSYFDRTQRETAVRSLERVNLLHRAAQRADSLSGGEKQRVSIARAITQQPKIILADEPVASLDPELAWQVIGDLARVAREDRVLTIICIHQLELAREFCDRIVGISQGMAVFDGPPSGLDQKAMNLIYRVGQKQTPPETAVERRTSQPGV